MYFTVSNLHHTSPTSFVYYTSKNTAIRNTQKEAIDIALQITRNQGSELFIHGKNGRIREHNSHGKDPFPPKG